ncbi:BNR-4 repeat-containing protein [Marinoscillum furvescens]|nr:BNR-4 repeat-containing protein [Marinoscillum furvescens]
MKMSIQVWCACVWSLLFAVGCETSKAPDAPILISEQGGDRATAYIMSNKIVSRGENKLITWLGADKVNQWALIDPNGVIIEQGSVGDARPDNHCGATLTKAPDGTIHMVLGGHWSAMDHYLLAAQSETIAWTKVSTLEAYSTYPALVAGSNGELHLTYRETIDEYAGRWELHHRKYEPENGWSEPNVLIRSPQKGYIYWTNSLALDPDGEILHLVFASVFADSLGNINHGAGHIYSADGGASWKQFDRKEKLDFPVYSSDLQLFTTDKSTAVLTPADTTALNRPGPSHYRYFQLMLSNLQVDSEENPAVVVQNLSTGDVDFYHHKPNGWETTPLTQLIPKGKRAHPQSTLSLDQSGQFHIILQIADDTGKSIIPYGDPSTELFWVSLENGEVQTLSVPKVVAETAGASWQPALEHGFWFERPRTPALLFTKGENGGGFSHNDNALRADVYYYLE